MCPEELEIALEELEAYVSGLHPQEKEEVKNYLRNVFSAHLQVNHDGKPGDLLEEQVTRLHLERIIPDEDTARAYLWALLERGQEIREIEGEKREVARRLVDPFSRDGKVHLELLEQVWGAQERPLGEDEGEFAARTIRWGDSNDTFDTWAEAELTRVKMEQFINGLAPVPPSKKQKIIQGTKLEGTRIPLRKWILATALVAQAKRSPTPKTLREIIPSRSTAHSVLVKLRLAMRNDMKALVASGNPQCGGYKYVDGLNPGFRLYYKNLGKDDSTDHRHDLVLRGIGNMLFVDNELDAIEFPGYVPEKAPEKRKTQIMDEFGRWISSHRDAEDPENRQYFLNEFACRYNADKKRFLGWSLINGLLRSLLARPRATDEDAQVNGV